MGESTPFDADRVRVSEVTVELAAADAEVPVDLERADDRAVRARVGAAGDGALAVACLAVSKRTTAFAVALALVAGGAVGYVWPAPGHSTTWTDIRPWVGFAVMVIGVDIALVRDGQLRELAGRQDTPPAHPPGNGVAPRWLQDLWHDHRLMMLAVAAVLGLAVSLALIWPITDLIAALDVGPIASSKRAAALPAARETVRTQLLTLSAGVGAAGALIYTARNFRLSRETFKLTERGQVTDRYTKAIDQLGSDKLDVRIGGIYALKRIAQDSTEDHRAVMEVLAAFVREQSRRQWPPPERRPDTPPGQVPEKRPRPDVQVAITVIGCRPRRDPEVIDLSGADLTSADLSGMDFIGANLSGANLSGANFNRAKFARADLRRADLSRAKLGGADLTGAILMEADLTGAEFLSAEFFGAYLAEADLAGAYLAEVDFGNADLSHANLIGADLRDAMLVAATLTEAQFAGDHSLGVPPGLPRTLAEVRTDLDGAFWPNDVPVPGGWEAIPGSRSSVAVVLQRAGSAKGRASTVQPPA